MHHYHANCSLDAAVTVAVTLFLFLIHVLPRIASLFQGHTGWEVIRKEEDRCIHHRRMSGEGFAADGEFSHGWIGCRHRFGIDFSQDVVFQSSDGVRRGAELVGVEPFAVEDVCDVAHLMTELLDRNMGRLGGC